jgi:hypothetical protein
MEQLTSIFGIVVTVLVSSTLGYVIGNALRYTTVVRDQDIMKVRIENCEKEILAIKVSETKILDEVKKMREEFSHGLNEIRLALSEKVDRV